MLALDLNLGVLWDMDGVIVDSSEAHYISWQKSLSRFGISFNRRLFDELLKIFWIIERLLNPRPFPGGYFNMARGYVYEFVHRIDFLNSYARLREFAPGLSCQRLS